MKKPGGTLNGFLDQGCSIKGDIVFADLLRVHGHASGTVRSDGELLVGEGGVVEGEIMVARLVVAGTVRGTIKARERLVVHGSGRITAEIDCSRLPEGQTLHLRLRHPERRPMRSVRVDGRTTKSFDARREIVIFRSAGTRHVIEANY